MRLSYAYNSHSYEQKHDNIIYVNTVHLSFNEIQLVWKLGYNEYTIESCEKTKELKLLDNGLKLICKDRSKDISLIDKGYLAYVYQISRNETAFVINENVIVNNVKNMKLEYNNYYTLELIDGNNKDYNLINEINYANENGEIVINNNINNEITLCNNYIYNRPLYASKLFINDLFTKDGVTKEIVYEVPIIKITAIPQIFTKNNETFIWTYEYLDSCLNGSDFVDEKDITIFVIILKITKGILMKMMMRLSVIEDENDPD
ncbi:hypothetical protein U3516DRAFT_839195 [Neocallimastix sp. 'constans']